MTQYLLGQVGEDQIVYTEDASIEPRKRCTYITQAGDRISLELQHRAITPELAYLQVCAMYNAEPDWVDGELEILG